MTGNKMIQYVLSSIEEAREDAIDKRHITLNSGNDIILPRDVFDQIEVLDLLRNQYECIRYTKKRQYESSEELASLISNLKQTLNDEYRLYDEINWMLNYMTYNIEVLDNFDEVAETLGALSEPVYTLHYKTNRELYINDIFLCKLTFGLQPEFLISQAFNTKDGHIALDRRSHSRSIVATLNDLKMKKPLWQLFFSNIEGNEFDFRPIVTKKDIEKERIDTKIVEEEIEKLKKTT